MLTDVLTYFFGVGYRGKKFFLVVADTFQPRLQVSGMIFKMFAFNANVVIELHEHACKLGAQFFFGVVARAEYAYHFTIKPARVSC